MNVWDWHLENVYICQQQAMQVLQTYISTTTVVKMLATKIKITILRIICGVPITVFISFG